MSMVESARRSDNAISSAQPLERAPANDHSLPFANGHVVPEPAATSDMSGYSVIFDEYEDDDGWLERLRKLAIPAAIMAVFVGVVLYFLHDTAGVRREAPELPTLMATLPPPPPPPPPPKQPEVERKVEVQQKAVETPKADAPRPVTINGPAQAGNDAFNVGAGNGGGDVGSGAGFGDQNYTRYLSSYLQQSIQGDDRLNTIVFHADVAVWIDGGGHVTRVEILRSSGDVKTDQTLVAALEATPALDEPPPSTLEFPQRFSVSGRRAA